MVICSKLCCLVFVQSHFYLSTSKVSTIGIARNRRHGSRVGGLPLFYELEKFLAILIK
jgi:hypothetical protein